MTTSTRRTIRNQSLGPERDLCRAETHGLLQRRPVKAIWGAVIGKQSNDLEAMHAGLIYDP